MIYLGVENLIFIRILPSAKQWATAVMCTWKIGSTFGSTFGSLEAQFYYVQVSKSASKSASNLPSVHHWIWVLLNLTAGDSHRLILAKIIISARVKKHRSCMLKRIEKSTAGNLNVNKTLHITHVTIVTCIFFYSHANSFLKN